MNVTLKSKSLSVTLHGENIVSVPSTYPDTTPADGQQVWKTALLNPLEMPKLPDCVVPGDQVGLIVDPDTPEIVSLVEDVYRQFLETDAAEINLTVLLPPDPDGNEWDWLTSQLSDDLRTRCRVQVHDPSDEQSCSYLASTAAGQRIYLNTAVVDADLLVTIGRAGWDSRLGVKGTSSVVFPAMSNAETLIDLNRMPHIEADMVSPNRRRDTVDEVGWLASTQFTVQVIPNPSGHIEAAFCGSPNAVIKEARQRLQQHWRVTEISDADLIVVSVIDTNERITWGDLGHALTVAVSVSDIDSRIAVVADVPEELGPGLTMLKRARDPRDLLKPLSLEPVSDSVATAQLIHATQQRTVFLRSQLSEELVEDLGLLAINSNTELQNLVNAASSVAIFPAANFLAGPSIS